MNHANDQTVNASLAAEQAAALDQTVIDQLVRVGQETEDETRIRMLKRIVKPLARADVKVAAEGSQSFPSKTHIRIMEPLSKAFKKDPEFRLRTLKNSLGVPDAPGFFVSVTLDNLINLLLQHKGHEDIRINTYAKNEDIEGLVLNVNDMLWSMQENKDVYQFVIRYTPAWIRSRRHEGNYNIPDNWIKADRIAALKDAQIRTVDEHCRRGNLTCDRFAEGDYYIKPDILLDYWIKSIPDYGALHQRLLLIQEVLDDTDPETPDEMFVLAAKLERANNITIRGAKSRVLFSNFVMQSLGNIAPKSIHEWRLKIRALVIMTRIKRNEVYGIETGTDIEPAGV